MIASIILLLIDAAMMEEEIYDCCQHGAVDGRRRKEGGRKKEEFVAFFRVSPMTRALRHTGRAAPRTNCAENDERRRCLPLCCFVRS